ncbi:MAG: NAD(+) synthase [Muribaculaceae bacterium]|nr:NAD(+) synthase [Muribaculaceae bacterium]
MKEGFFRVAAGAPKVTVADPAANAANISQLMREAAGSCADMLVLPELCITAYTCADLFHNQSLLDSCNKAVAELLALSTELPGLLTWIGVPVYAGNVLYNCAVAICNGTIVAAVPKTYIPNYNEFYEARWFAPAAEQPLTATVAGSTVPVGAAIICHKGVNVSAEICEDLWAPVAPSMRLAMAGAEVMVNLSASDDIIGKYDYLRSLVAQQSARCLCAYAYASAGFGESSTDLVFDAKLFVAENGRMLTANKRWQHGNQLIVTDVDIEAIRRDRMHNGTFENCRRHNGVAVKESISSDTAQPSVYAIPLIHSSEEFSALHDKKFTTTGWQLMRDVDPHPFVPANGEILDERCLEITSIQTAALAKRLEATHCRSLTIGISGGLDSTLALLVATRAFDLLGLDRRGIIGVTMPGFGTTKRTHSNATLLMEALGISVREVSIVPGVQQHFSDIGHDPEVHDVTYENSQARMRTMILMDIANETGGMVLGTGDLSELALGWATYNGDHMSMYGVNAGVPKTLVRYLTRWYAERTDNADERRALLDIIDTPISPELLPAREDGTIDQRTEDLVGPYELHDFFLYYVLRYGFSPRRIFLLALKAFGDSYERATILKWLRTFFRRFFTQQFKRSCLPDSPKVGSVCLSPRGDWRMPSDASSEAWMREIDLLQ